MNRTKMIICLALTATVVSAQTFTDRLRQHEDGRGTVTITQTAEVEDLVNNAQLVPRKPQAVAQSGQPQSVAQPQQSQQQAQPQQAQPQPVQQQPVAQQPASQQPVQQPAQSSGQPAGQKSTTSKPTTTPPPANQQAGSDDSHTDTSKKMIRGGKKVQGYRVQVFSGGNSREDRQKAERIGAAMKSHFPDQPVYVHFYSPSWKCRIGNYRTQEEARLVLAQVKQLGYSSACIVKGTITVQ